MKHEPGRGPEWEPEWLKEMRDIERRIAHSVDRHIAVFRRTRVVWFFAGMGGYWFGAGVVELLRYWLSLK